MPTQKKDRHGKMIWYGRVTVEGKDKAKACKTKREAIAWETEQKKPRRPTQQNHTEPQTIHTASLVDLATAYLKDKEGQISKGNFNAKKLAFRRLFTSINPNTPVSSVSKFMMHEHISNIARKISNNTANVDLLHIIAAYNWGIEMEILPAPCPWKAQKLRIHEADVYVPTFEDLTKVLSVAKTFQDKIMIQIYFETAARRSEILRLKWQDVDLERNTVRLWTGKRKGGMQSDVIGITEQLSRLLTEHKLKTGLLEYVFINPKSNKPYTDRGAWLDGLIKKAGVKRFTTHQIRHLVASTLIDEKESLGTVQAVLRHKSATTTARYIHRLRGVELPTAIAEKVPRLNPEQALRNNVAENM